MKRSRKPVGRKPQSWQINANMIITSRVQFWKNGIMNVVTREEARNAVIGGYAFVMTEQAIGLLDADGFCQS